MFRCIISLRLFTLPLMSSLPFGFIYFLHMSVKFTCLFVFPPYHQVFSVPSLGNFLHSFLFMSFSFVFLSLCSNSFYLYSFCADIPHAFIILLIHRFHFSSAPSHSFIIVKPHVIDVTLLSAFILHIHTSYFFPLRFHLYSPPFFSISLVTNIYTFLLPNNLQYEDFFILLVSITISFM